MIITSKHPCWSLCADLCDSLKEIAKVPVSGHSRLKSNISERMLFQLWNAHPMLKICVALNKEKGIASFRNPVPMRTIRTMIWYFHITDIWIDLLAFPNNREFTRSNRVYGHFCWNYFWELLSYRQKSFGECEMGKIVWFISLTKHWAKLLWIFRLDGIICLGVKKLSKRNMSVMKLVDF